MKMLGVFFTFKFLLSNEKIYLAWRSVWLKQYHIILELSTVSKGDVIDIYFFLLLTLYSELSLS